MPRPTTNADHPDTVYVADCRLRRPFEVTRLPLAARLYRYRKGAFGRTGWAHKLARVALPSKLFLKCLFACAGKRTSGEFLYRQGQVPKSVKFRFTNSQFRALYFPEYADGYEPETTCLIDKILAAEPKATFYDIGANWGFYSLYAASLSGYRGRIEAFEPQPDTFRDLTSVVAQADLGERVTCHRAALSDKNAAGFIALPDGVNSGLAALTTSSGEPTQLIALDSLACEPPGLLKVDVEGAEAEVFQGGRRVLSQYQPMIVFESWHNRFAPNESLRPLQVLHDFGYRFFQPTLAPGDGDEHLLSLAEFTPPQRPLLAEHFNVFACHRARCDRWLAENFTAVWKHSRNATEAVPDSAGNPLPARRAA